jgi:hypothetical protein
MSFTDHVEQRTSNLNSSIAGHIPQGRPSAGPNVIWRIGVMTLHKLYGGVRLHRKQIDWKPSKRAQLLKGMPTKHAAMRPSSRQHPASVRGRR